MDLSDLFMTGNYCFCWTGSSGCGHSPQLSHGLYRILGIAAVQMAVILSLNK